MKGRNQSLDVLRGVAILLVLGAHSFWPYVRTWRNVGESGVPLFFVLSGYLISGLLFAEYQKTGTLNVPRFWIRRGFKIYPGFYVLLVATVVAKPLIFGGFQLRSAILSGMFLQNYAQSALLFIPQSWSLAVEEHFYLLLPLLLLVLIRFEQLRLVPWLSAASLVVCTYLRMHSSGMAWRETHLCADALMIGVAIGYAKYLAPRWFPQRSRIAWLLASGALLAPIFILDQYREIGAVGITVQYVGFAGLLLWAIPRAVSFNPGVRAVAWIGRYSYSIYLWHLAGLVAVAFFGNTFLALALYLIIAIGLGVGMATLIEVPALRLRERVVPALASSSRSYSLTARRISEAISTASV